MLSNYASLTENSCCHTTKGLQGYSDHSNGFLKVTEADSFFQKPSQMTGSGFQKPLFDKIRGYLCKSSQSVGIELVETS